MLDERAILVADGGDFVATASYVLRPRRPLAWLDPGVFGTLGVGAGFSVSRLRGTTERGVDDLGRRRPSATRLPRSTPSPATACRSIGLIGNDASWAQIARDQVELLGDDVGTTLAPHRLPSRRRGFRVACSGPGDRRRFADRTGLGEARQCRGFRFLGDRQRAARRFRLPQGLAFDVIRAGRADRTTPGARWRRGSSRRRRSPSPRVAHRAGARSTPD